MRYGILTNSNFTNQQFKKNRMKTTQILTNDLRENLKKIMQLEILKIPEYLNSLEPKDKINTLCKLMPYVFPKVEGIDCKDNEPLSW